MKQIITKLWIDESGDCGFKLNKGSSRFLVIIAVYLIDANKIEASINQLRLKLGLTEDYEFKFSRCKDKFRKEFFSLIRALSIQYKAIVVDKEKLSPPDLRFITKSLIEY